MTIKLTPELERAIPDEAQKCGTTAEVLVLDSLRQRFLTPRPTETPAEEGSLADDLADFIGVLGSGEHVPGGARMSEGTGRKFAEGMHGKREAGKL
jgi:hypothetical protein